MRLNFYQDIIDVLRGKKTIKEVILRTSGYNKKLNSEIKKYKYLHLMFNEKFNKPYVDFLNKNFNKKEHIVLCKRTCKQYPFPEGENVFEIAALKGLNFETAEKVFLHSLFDGEVVDYMFEHQDILKEKSYWIIWGGDLYNAPEDEKNNFIRKNVKGYIALVKDDAFIAKERYGSNPELFNTPYIDPMGPYIMKTAENIRKPDFIKIQINNSCDKTTLDMLEILSKFKDENIKITTPLSYGDMKYKDEIIQKGREIFGEKFEYLDKMMKPEDYVKHLSKNVNFVDQYDQKSPCSTS